MRVNELTYLLIDTNWIKEFWRKEISSGRAPDTITLSILSRLVVYEGKATETPTIKIPAVKNFTPSQLSSKEILVLKRLESAP
jgi:hypothetical protein